jgi:hypothetical protein
MLRSCSRPRLRAAFVALALLAVGTGLLGASPVAGAAPTPATFTNYASPSGTGNDAAEPSIGVNWNTGSVMYLGGFEAFRVTGFATGSPTWRDVSPPLQTISADPILFTDSTTGRTFVSQLAADCSQIFFTDNDGGNGAVTDWTNNPVGCGLAATPDHQTVGGGPFAPGQSGIGYSHSVYYCAQGNATAECALSINGGLSFNPAVPIYTALDCFGLHGHLRAAPNGTVYVPNADCGGQAAVIRSTNNGTNWSVLKVPGSTTQDESDPSVAVASDGTVYFGWQQGNGHAYAAVSSDQGAHWSTPIDVGALAGVQNMQFPEMIAGDGTRAAYAFLGTPTSGNDQTTSFAGVWHLYVATTFDRGASWSVVDATPSDPVQRGMICMAGTLGCPSNSNGTDTRNLLDFMDITVGKDGKVYVGYADGCVGSCITSGSGGNSGTAKATIAAQSGGYGLISAYDPSGPTVPGTPVLSATAGNASVSLSWTAPANGGSAITNYKVYRGTSSGGETLLTTLGDVSAYTDTAVTNGTTYYYQVSAVNAVGEGARSNEVSARPTAPQPPTAPSNLTASTVKGGKNAKGVKLAWGVPSSSGSSAITGYRIYRGTSSGGETFYTSVGVVTSYTDTGTTSGTVYYYRVTAVNSAGESPQSNEANAVAK